MKTGRNKIATGMVALTMALAVGCSDEQPLTTREGAEVTFRLSTKVGEEGTVKTPTYTRLYLAERKPDVFVGQETLHCSVENRYEVTGGTYTLTGLYGQWYKFAFLSVPDPEQAGLGATMFSDTGADFNTFQVDYAPALQYQIDKRAEAEKADLSVYRRVIDRWIDAGDATSEDVLLGRQTGHLFLKLGIPADQFDLTEGKTIGRIDLVVTAPNDKMALRDGAEDALFLESGATQPYTFSLPVEDPSAFCEMSLSLLPDTLDAVLEAYDKDNKKIYSHAFTNESGDPIRIKRNVRTTVLFNGIHDGSFEIRYAGFDGNAVVDVDDDAWDGVDRN